VGKGHCFKLGFFRCLITSKRAIIIANKIAITTKEIVLVINQIEVEEELLVAVDVGAVDEVGEVEEVGVGLDEGLEGGLAGIVIVCTLLKPLDRPVINAS
jgi:hypothetical protein